MDAFDPSAYGATIAALLRDAPLSSLDPGRPDPSRQLLLGAMANDDAFLPNRVVDPSMANACRAGLWLLFHFLGESHALSQVIDTPEGAYWHALMHRREGDFSNAKYWFRRVGVHPIYSPLQAAARELAGDSFHPTVPLLWSEAVWNPYAFTDLCEASLTDKSSWNVLCRRIQEREWQLLLDYCYRRAVI